jgi:hypothetical protein
MRSRNDEFSKNLEATLRILGARRVTRSTAHAEGPQTLGATMQNLVTCVTRDLCIPLEVNRYHSNADPILY